jgi:hypothetical protein
VHLSARKWAEALVGIVIVFTILPMASPSLNLGTDLSKICVCLDRRVLGVDLDPSEILLQSVSSSHQCCEKRLSQLCQVYWLDD